MLSSHRHEKSWWESLPMPNLQVKYAACFPNCHSGGPKSRELQFLVCFINRVVLTGEKKRLQSKSEKELTSKKQIDSAFGEENGLWLLVM